MITRNSLNFFRTKDLYSKNNHNGYSVVETIIVLAVLSIFGIAISRNFTTLINESEKKAAIKKIISIKEECESNYIYGLGKFTNSRVNGYELEIRDLRNCEGDPDHGFINLIPNDINNNPSLHYEFQNGLLTCDIPNFELTPFPDCKPITKSKIRYRCKDIGDWNLAQSLLNKGHSYLDRDKDGEACEALSRDSDKPEIGIVTIDNCYDGDTCTTTDGEKIRLACIDTPELRGKKADPVEAKRSRDYLNSLVLGKELDIRRVTKDRYGRTVAELYISDINIQRNLVENGYAKIYEKYSDPCPWAKN